MTDAIKIEDLIIDPETGEVLEMPEGVAEPIVYLTQRALEAQTEVKAWEAYYGMLKAALGRKLDEQGLRSLRTEYGTPAWRRRSSDVGVIERLPEVAKRFELSATQIEFIVHCAKSLDVAKLEGLVINAVAPRDAIEALIERKSTSYVVVERPRTAAPKMERVQVV